MIEKLWTLNEQNDYACEIHQNDKIICNGTRALEIHHTSLSQQNVNATVIN